MDKKIVLFLVFFVGFIIFMNVSSASFGYDATTGQVKVINYFNYTINETEVQHNILSGLQGGTAGEYYHINQSWFDELLSDIFDWITQTEGDARYFLISDWNTNYTANNDAWLNTTNLTYDAYNSTGLIKDWNSTGLIINWSGDYLTLTQLLGFGYYNSTDFSISDYFTKSDILGFSYYNSTDFNIGDYLLKSDWNTNYSTNDANWRTTYNSTYDAYNSTGLIKDWNASGLIANWSGDYLTEETLWNANYSTFLTHISLSDLLGFSYYNSTDFDINDYLLTSNWNATNESYYLATNPLGFYNVTTAPIYLNDTFAGNYTNFTTIYGYAINSTDTDTFVANYSDYLTIRDYALNDTDFNVTGLIKDWNDTGLIKDFNASSLIIDWNASGLIRDWTFAEDLWNANYSTFLTHIDWATATNGTLAELSTILGFGYYNSTDFDISDYSTTATILGWNYYNSTDFSISDYTPTSTLLGWGYYNITDFNIADYLDLSTLLGFNYYNATDFSISDYATNVKVDSLGNFSAWDKDYSDLINVPTLLSQFTDDLGNRGYTHLSNFTNNLNIGNWTLDKPDYSTTSTLLGWGYYNSTDFSIADYYLKNNPFGFYNSTTIPSYIETELDPLWTGNQSGYFTSADTIAYINANISSANNSMKDYVDLLNATGLIKDWNVDGYIKDWNSTGLIINWSIADLNATGLVRDWNDTGLIKDWDPDSYIKDWNETGLIINWSGDYLTLSELLEFSYYNSTDFDISDYFTSAQVLEFSYYNSTDFDINDYLDLATLLGFNYYNSTDFSISDYFTKSDILGFGYYNSTDFDIADYYLKSNPFGFWNNTYATFNKTYADTLYQVIGSYLTSEEDPFWLANYSDFLTISAWNNTGLIKDWNAEGYIKDWNASGHIKDWDPNSYIKDWNSTGWLIDWNTPIASANTSLYNWVVGQNYLTSFTEQDPKWTANYSTFLTHIPWTTAMNGTLMSQATFNTNYTANDAAYRNTTNTTYNAYNSTGLIKDWNVTGYIKNWWVNVVNGTALLTATWNTNYTANNPKWSSFAANYSTYLTHIPWATAYNGTLAKTDSANTFTGINTHSANVSMGNNYIVNGTGGAYIYHNGTGWVIKG